MHDDAPDSPAPESSDRDAPASPLFRLYLALELAALYAVVPLFIDLSDRTIGRSLIPALGVVGILMFLTLLFSKKFPNRSLWNWPAFKAELPRILVTAAIAFGIMVGLAAWISAQPWGPDSVRPLGFVLERPKLFIAIALLYPIFSVYPQEIVLRTFFFHRYKPLLSNRVVLLTVNALVFAWVHVIFDNWIAVLLCIPAGFLFGYTYLNTKSTLASGVEHAIVGNLMWAAGLGFYFYAGAVPERASTDEPPATMSAPDPGPSPDRAPDQPAETPPLQEPAR